MHILHVFSRMPKRAREALGENPSVLGSLSVTTHFSMSSMWSHENKASPLPSHDSAQQLADRFALFFKEKIDKIRRELPIVDPLPVYLPPAPTVLDCFAPTTFEEMRQIISRSPASTCHLDAIPTWLLKDSLDATISHLVVVINSSLEEGLMR